jgi:hypothetical protein
MFFIGYPGYINKILRLVHKKTVLEGTVFFYA